MHRFIQVHAIFKSFLSIGASEWLAVLDKYTVLMLQEKGELSEIANPSGLLTAMVHSTLHVFPTALKMIHTKFATELEKDDSLWS